jgi:nicotinamide riboside transporter PnuC
MDYIAALLIVFGNHLLAYKSKWGWISSILGSIVMIINFLPKGVYSIVVLNIVFATQGIYGLFKWRYEERVARKLLYKVSGLADYRRTV